MIVRSIAKSLLLEASHLNNVEELEERCSLCEGEIPDGFVVLRHTESNHILCVPCLGWIAMLNPDD